MIINKYMLDIYIYIYIFNPWKIFCDLNFHEVYKPTFIRQLRRWNELKIESTTKYWKKTLGFPLCVAVNVWVYVCMCVCVIVTCIYKDIYIYIYIYIERERDRGRQTERKRESKQDNILQINRHTRWTICFSYNEFYYRCIVLRLISNLPSFLFIWLLVKFWDRFLKCKHTDFLFHPDMKTPYYFWYTKYNL